MIDPVISTLICTSIALLLGHAAWLKGRDLRKFSETIRSYDLLPVGFDKPAATIIFTLESVLAMLLLAPGTRSSAAMGAGTLLLVYALAIASNLLRGRRDLDCGCTGPAINGRRGIAAWMVGRNVVLATLLFLASLPESARELTGVDLLTLAGGLATVPFLYSAVHIWKSV